MQLWQSLCNSRPLPPHDWPCCHIQRGDYGKSTRPPPVFCPQPVWNITTRARAHTRLRIKTRGCSGHWFLFVCLFISWFGFCPALWHTLLEPSSTVEPRHVKNWPKHLVQQPHVTPRKLTSCNINLTRVPAEMRMSDHCSTFIPTQTLHLISHFQALYSTRRRASWVISYFCFLFSFFFFPPSSQTKLEGMNLDC